MTFLILGLDSTTGTIKREYEVEEDTFWRLRARHIPRDQDRGYGGVILDQGDLPVIVPKADLDQFTWTVDSMREDIDGDW